MSWSIITASVALVASTEVKSSGDASSSMGVGNFLSYAFPSRARALYTSFCRSAIARWETVTAAFVSATTTGAEGAEPVGLAREERTDSRDARSPSRDSATVNVDEGVLAEGVLPLEERCLDDEGREVEEEAIGYSVGTLAATRSTSFSMASMLSSPQGRCSREIDVVVGYNNNQRMVGLRWTILRAGGPSRCGGVAIWLPCTDGTTEGGQPASQGRLADQQPRASHTKYHRSYHSEDDLERHVFICIYCSPSAPLFISSNSFLKPSLTTTEMP